MANILDTSEREAVRIVAVVQCAIALERCSGFSCSRAFHRRTHFFKGYPQDAMYLPFSCGGCPGRRVSRLATHLAQRARREENVEKQHIAVHLTGCVVCDNGHYPKCPFKDYIKAILEQKGFAVVEGGYEAAKSERRRAEEYYKAYECLEGGLSDERKSGSGLEPDQTEASS